MRSTSRGHVCLQRTIPSTGPIDLRSLTCSVCQTVSFLTEPRVIWQFDCGPITGCSFRLLTSPLPPAPHPYLHHLLQSAHAPLCAGGLGCEGTKLSLQVRARLARAPDATRRAARGGGRGRASLSLLFTLQPFAQLLGTRHPAIDISVPEGSSFIWRDQV